ncbi:MAG: alpha/beta hydrolase [Candidatus Omnitrophota bacterium]|nr:alpha/beta hydrolase [Candidatus Omnitrophota bacterium]
MNYILTAIVIALLVILYCRWFERHNAFFPAGEIKSTPDSIGLDYEDIYFETSDGRKINAWFIPAARPRATVLFCHGNAGNISHRLEIIRIFNRLNLNMLIFDYRGFGRSRGWPSEQGTYLDARAAYDYLISRNDIAHKKIVIYGKSLGAAVAIDLALKVKPRALISESAFTSALEMGKLMYPYLPIKHIITMRYDNVSKIKELTVPKLIIHSIDDEIVPFEYGQRLFKQAAGPKEFYQMRGSHNDAFLMSEQEFEKRIGRFICACGIE